MIETLAWTRESWADYKYWQNQYKKILKRINKLLVECLRSPFEGVGKPEPLTKRIYRVSGLDGSMNPTG